jgi:hypothetical protein
MLHNNKTVITPSPKPIVIPNSKWKNMLSNALSSPPADQVTITNNKDTIEELREDDIPTTPTNSNSNNNNTNKIKKLIDDEYKTPTSQQQQQQKTTIPPSPIYPTPTTNTTPYLSTNNDTSIHSSNNSISTNSIIISTTSPSIELKSLISNTDAAQELIRRAEWKFERSLERETTLRSQLQMERKTLVTYKQEIQHEIDQIRNEMKQKELAYFHEKQNYLEEYQVTMENMIHTVTTREKENIEKIVIAVTKELEDLENKYKLAVQDEQHKFVVAQKIQQDLEIRMSNIIEYYKQQSVKRYNEMINDVTLLFEFCLVVGFW